MALCSNKKVRVIPSPIHLSTDIQNDGWVVVVVDILRATTAICAAFASGCKEVVPVGNIDAAMSYAKRGYKIVAERGGKIVAGADYGNSPCFFRHKDMRDERLAYTTTNGTKAISLSSSLFERVIIGAFSNFTCLTEELIKANSDVAILCSGWQNTVSIEDTLFAGAISDALSQHHFILSNDSAELSVSLWHDKKTHILNTLKASEHGRRLMNLGFEQDIEFAAQIDTCNCVPQLINHKLVL
ncbi:MAG: 2-phosphosulfolactate phosphatase [Bacteroidales bacterium]|nr:2-phosphosulfolactate phosphatase [Bacteroidales bacterium]